MPKRKQKPTARFRVSHRNEDWMVCTPLNTDAKILIHNKGGRLWAKWPPEFNPSNPDVEKRELIKKANSLSGRHL